MERRVGDLVWRGGPPFGCSAPAVRDRSRAARLRLRALTRSVRVAPFFAASLRPSRAGASTQDAARQHWQPVPQIKA